MVWVEGLEPPAPWLQARTSAADLYPDAAAELLLRLAAAGCRRIERRCSVLETKLIPDRDPCVCYLGTAGRIRTFTTELRRLASHPWNGGIRASKAIMLGINRGLEPRSPARECRRVTHTPVARRRWAKIHSFRLANFAQRNCPFRAKLGTICCKGVSEGNRTPVSWMRIRRICHYPTETEGGAASVDRLCDLRRGGAPPGASGWSRTTYPP